MHSRPWQAAFGGRSGGAHDEAGSVDNAQLSVERNMASSSIKSRLRSGGGGGEDDTILHSAGQAPGGSCSEATRQRSGLKGSDETTGEESISGRDQEAQLIAGLFVFLGLSC